MLSIMYHMRRLNDIVMIILIVPHAFIITEFIKIFDDLLKHLKKNSWKVA